MSVHALDKFLNNVFDIYAMPGMSSDFTYSRDEYYVSSDDKQVMIEMPLVGISKDDLKIEIEDNMLIIQATSSKKSKSVRNIKKSWYVDDSIDVSAIAAKLENGLLVVSLPKTKSAKKSVAVTIS
jgi:HSP20 family molecular chaperone IbpA